MIDRIGLKARGKAAFLKNYWVCVLVCLVLTLLADGGFQITKRVNQRNEFVQQQQTTSFAAGENGAFQMQAQAESPISAATDKFLSNYLLTGVATAVAVSIAGIGLVFSIFVGNPLLVGGRRFFLNNRESRGEFGTLGYAFQNGYMNVVAAMFKRGLFTFLWTLLFLIPGIIKTYEYMLVPYLLAEHPDMDSGEALRRSRDMMEGYKGAAFMLQLSFIGWALLSALTAGVLGIFWFNPYYNATETEFYVSLRDGSAQRGGNGGGQDSSGGAETAQGYTRVDYDSDRYKGPEL